MQSLTASSTPSLNLYLGPWCTPLFGNFQNAGNADNILPYHWGNPAKFEKDFPEVCNAYERSLAHFSTVLGRTLNVTEDVNFGVQ